MAAVDGRQVAADGDRAPSVVAREVELRQPRERPDDRRAVPVTLAEAERLRGVGDGQLNPGGRLVEPGRQVAEQQHCGRAQRREPERLHVQRAGIVAQRVEQERKSPLLGSYRMLRAAAIYTRISKDDGEGQG